MKKSIPVLPLVGFTFLLMVLACRKSVNDTLLPSTIGSYHIHDSTPPNPVKTDSTTVFVLDTTKPAAPFPQAPVTGCTWSPNYGDTIIYPQPTNGSDYIISPVNNPPAGKYLSWPIGMSIDSVTGAIDVTKSQTGMKYAIGFVKAGGTDTCLSTLIIGGAAYMDSIYVLSQGATVAVPYFEANPTLFSVCSGSNSCAFDVTGSAASKRVIVNTATGDIDLTKTLNGTTLLGGVFGLLPFNGETATATIYYRLGSDGSNNALQHIDLQFVYYFSKSQIGTGLLSNVLTKLDNLLTGNLISTTSNPRPPLIIIVRGQ